MIHYLDEFCGSPFWDANLTWHSDPPDLTPCFENTVLVWLPGLLLLLLLPLDCWWVSLSTSRNIPWSWLNVSQMTVTTLMMTVSVANLVIVAQINNTHPSDLAAPIVHFITFGTLMVLVLVHKSRGIRASYISFITSFALVVCQTPRIYSIVREFVNKIPYNVFLTGMDVILYILLWTFFILHWFCDKQPQYSKFPDPQRPSPETWASVPSRISLAWFSPLVRLGSRRPLQASDMFDLDHANSARVIVPTFQRHWAKSLGRAYTKVSFDDQSTKVKFHPRAKSSASILPALIKSFGPYFLLGSLLKFLADLLMFAQPLLLKLLIQFVSSDDSLWKGCMVAILMYVVAILQILHMKQYFLIMNFTGIRITTALISAIYEKSLKLSNGARKRSTVGEIVNLMAVDVGTFHHLTMFINQLWAAPTQIFLAMVFLWQLLGPAALVGLGVMVVMIPLNAWMVRQARRLRTKQMKFKDERIKVMNEVISGIKVLKLYAWEPSFEQKITRIRQQEIKVLKTAALFSSFSDFTFSITPYLVAVCSFAFFVLYDEHNILDAQTAFVSLALFNILRAPLSMFTQMLNILITASVALKRINKFLNNEELDTSSVTHDPKERDQVVVENGTFSWDGADCSEFTLKDINLRISPGALVAIVGSVGSGKSSLLSAILGEMDKISGRVNTKGTIAYVPQQAWIQNVSLRKNITGPREFNKAVFRKVVKACALEQDIEMLPGGDLTEIGEKGINLSGGQKQRVSLARAVYSRADLYLLDDPLSAVDSHVGKHIFDNVIGPAGVLRKTTRLLVTHGVSFLPEVDWIVVMKDGHVSECGTYKQLIANKGDFADFLLQYLEQDSEGESGLEEMRDEFMKDESLRNRYMRAVNVKANLKRQISLESTVSSKVTLNESKTSLNSHKTDGEPKDLNKKLMTVEETEIGNVKLGVFLFYLRSIGALMTIVAVGGVVLYQVFLVSANLWLTRWSSDRSTVVNGTQDLGRTHLYLGVYAALGVGQAVSSVIANIALSLGCLFAAASLHRSMLQRLLRAPMSFFDTTPLGRVINRFSRDIDVCDSVLSYNLQQFLILSIQTIAIIGVITYTTPPFIIAIIPIFIINFYFQRLYVATSRQLKRLQSTTRSPIYSHFSETIQGAQSIRAYRLQEAFISESEQRVDFHQRCAYSGIIAQRWLAFRLEVVGNLIVFFAALLAVLSRDSLDAGLAGLSVTYALQVISTINFFTRMTANVETNLVSVERIKEYTQVKQEAAWTVEPAPDPRWPSDGRIEFHNYQVRYREGLDLVLRGVTFTVLPGEKVGVVGRTGAGKSSLTLALFRVLEAAGGRVVVDGRDVAYVGLHQLRSRLTIIPQDPVLWSGTLRNNLDPFDLATEESLWKALELSNLKAFVKGLPLGLDHPISEGGENLSVGQKQLLCLARALLRKTKILVLDEATAAVDLETDDAVQRTLRSQFRDCTVLTIAHRLHTVLDYDRILVLEKGKVEEYDTPKNLLQNHGSVFYSMAKDAGIVS